MRWKFMGLACVLVGFIGCGAAPEESNSSDPANPVDTVDTVKSAATSCPSYTASLQDQVTAGRAVRVDQTFLFWSFPTYSTAGDSPEQIGTVATTVVTLYPKTNGYTTNASLCQQATCGNGVLESPTEQCDGNQYAYGISNSPYDEVDCNSLVSGQPYAPDSNVGCTSKCQYDFSVCRRVVCGDGKAEGQEQCDGQDLGITQCSDYPGGAYTSGQVKCKSDCTYDTSGCTTLCGNGVLDPGEDCDGSLFSATYAGKTCTSFLEPYPTWPFGIQVPYLAGPITCNNTCKINVSASCKIHSGCFYVLVAGSQPSGGVQCH